jgi:adenosine kinase
LCAHGAMLNEESALPPERNAVVSASIAYDYIMGFGGSFADHIIPEKAHVISVSFLVDSLRKQRGGVAGNICYTLALLGESSHLVGAVGTDFAPYRAAFEQLCIGMDNVIQDDGTLTASAFMMADLKSNQIASFYPGPGSLAAGIDVTELGHSCRFGLIGPTDPEVMRLHARQLGNTNCKLIFDPAFQIIIFSGEDLRDGIDSAWCVVGNDYEFAMIERKTGLNVSDIAAQKELVVVTYGEKGSDFILNGETTHVPVAPARQVVDPTGAGDAFRGGMLRGLLLDLPPAITGRIANLAAVYAVEQTGTQEHSYTIDEFVERFDTSFPDYAGSISVAQLEGISQAAL